jgi:hypothetical protein
LVKVLKTDPLAEVCATPLTVIAPPADLAQVFSDQAFAIAGSAHKRTAIARILLNICFSFH